MKQFFTTLYKNRFLTMLVWLIVVVIAIISSVKLGGNVESRNNLNYATSQTEQQAASIQKQWGYGQKNGQNISVVYQNPKGKITSKQQTQIQKTVTDLSQHKSFYSLKKITSVATNVLGQNQLVSNDGSTMMVTLGVNSDSSSLNVLTNQLILQTKVTGLKNYITSPQIIRNVNDQRIGKVTTIVLIASFIGSMILMGIFFRSLLVPLVSFVTEFIALVTSYGITLFGADKFNWVFSQYSLIIIGITTIIIGTIWNFTFFKQFKQLSGSVRNSAEATIQTVKTVRKPIISIGICLAIIFAFTGLLTLPEMRSLWVLSITYLVLILATLTINPIFTQPLGTSVYWPSHSSQQDRQSAYYNRASRFGLWQPIASLILVLYLVVPFAWLYHNNLNYSPMTNLTQSNQAVKGAQVLAAHFTGGKATPITIYLQNNKSLANEKSLEPLDALTTKLNSTPGVSAVYSVTQPGGMPIQQYYVSNQLESIGLTAKQASGALTKSVAGIKSNRSNLNVSQLNTKVSELQKVASQSSQVASTSSNVATQVQKATSDSSGATQSSASRKVRKYQRQIRRLNASLQAASANLATLTSASQSAQSGATSSSSYFNNYKAQITDVNTQLKKVQQDVKNSNTQLNSIYTYLDGLQKSPATTNAFYITPVQMASADFTQTTLNYFSQNKKITTIQVIMKSAPSAKANVKLTKQLQNQVRLQLRGTSLANAKVAFAGEPITQAATQKHQNRDLIKLFAILIIGMLITAFIVSRSVLQPIYWIIAFIISSIAGSEIASLLMKLFTHVGQFDWQVPTLAASILVAIGLWEITILGMTRRQENVAAFDWILPTMTHLGTSFGVITLTVAVLGFAITFGSSYAMIETALIIGCSMIIFYLILPVIVAGVGKLTVTLPTRKFGRKKES